MEAITKQVCTLGNRDQLEFLDILREWGRAWGANPIYTKLTIPPASTGDHRPANQEIPGIENFKVVAGMAMLEIIKDERLAMLLGWATGICQHYINLTPPSPDHQPSAVLQVLLRPQGNHCELGLAADWLQKLWKRHCKHCACGCYNPVVADDTPTSTVK